MIKFENNVQKSKFGVLKIVSKLAMEGKLEDNYKLIPKMIVPGPKSKDRCCIYKERVIVEERVKMAMGGDKNNKNIIEVLDAACDECPVNRFVVTEACRGCLAHRCSEACPVGAIYHIGQKACIDYDKCIECGKCSEACPYNAIADVARPCRKACPADAISIDENKKAVIDNEKCIQCGACVFQCPFGAITDKSSIVNVIELLNKAKKEENLHIYATIAPSISSQFPPARIEQVICGIKKLGFYDVVEVALGADMVALHEAEEVAKMVNYKDFVTSSCCPAFVAYIKKKYPKLADHISTTVSPMIAISRLIKHMDNKAKVVFIGPCTAKKAEIMEEDIKGSTDYVLTFEELAAMIEAADINLEDCNDGLLNNASFYGRIFARVGGVTEAVQHVIESNEIDLDFKPTSCDGIKECDKALKIANVGRFRGNFIEGMACQGGCISGPASLHHGPKDKREVDKYGKMALEQNVDDSLRVFEIEKIDLSRGK